MVRGFSKAIVTGNITRDPELRTTPNGANTCTISVAVNRSYKDASGNNQEAVSFIDCVFWNKAAEIVCQYAKKGTGILVSGRLDQRSWEDKESGQKRSRVEIVVEDFNFLSGNERDGDFSTSAPRSSKKAAAEESAEEFIPDDIPMDGDINVDEIPF